MRCGAAGARSERHGKAAPTLVARPFTKRELDGAPPWPPEAPRRVVVEPGVWYRVAS